jgi:FimV-like protein
MLKKTLLSVLIAVSASPLVAIAADTFSGAPTPVQTYKTATPPPAAAKSDESAMAQVQAIMAKAKQEAAQNQAAKPAVANNNMGGAPNPSSAPENVALNQQQAQPQAQAQGQLQAQTQPQLNQASATMNAKNNGNLAQNTSEISGQVSTLNQNTLMFEQRTDQQIEALSTKNADLTAQLTHMGQALTLLNQEVVQLNSQISQLRSGVSSATIVDGNASIWQRIKPELFEGVPYIVYAAMAALVVIVLLMLPWYRRDARGLAPVEKPGSSAEYDFMGTHEAIPAKLDLARAYIAMEDHEAAKLVLLEVQKDGDASQKGEAEKMLESISFKL